jgi:hypothetical protein
VAGGLLRLRFGRHLFICAPHYPFRIALGHFFEAKFQCVIDPRRGGRIWQRTGKVQLPPYAGKPKYFCLGYRKGDPSQKGECHALAVGHYHMNRCFKHRVLTEENRVQK